MKSVQAVMEADSHPRNWTTSARPGTASVSADSKARGQSEPGGVGGEERDYLCDASVADGENVEVIGRRPFEPRRCVPQPIPTRNGARVPKCEHRKSADNRPRDAAGAPRPEPFPPDRSRAFQALAASL